MSRTKRRRISCSVTWIRASLSNNQVHTLVLQPCHTCHGRGRMSHAVKCNTSIKFGVLLINSASSQLRRLFTNYGPLRGERSWHMLFRKYYMLHCNVGYLTAWISSKQKELKHSLTGKNKTITTDLRQRLWPIDYIKWLPLSTLFGRIVFYPRIFSHSTKWPRTTMKILTISIQYPQNSLNIFETGN